MWQETYPAASPPNTGRLATSAFSSVVFPTPLFPRITVHCRGLPWPSDRSSVCAGPKQRTFSSVSDKK
ncbi:hypothetical protein BE11_45895 [Sorangium cellulosum]|nr:hypothetical protein BE11_45895 [Sorangium cellulosum]